MPGSTRHPAAAPDARPDWIAGRARNDNSDEALMLYRENGQFKSSYRADQQIFPILQDRIFIIAVLAFAFLAVPLLVSDYMFRAILIPFLIFSLAAIGVNILVGYCGQIS